MANSWFITGVSSGLGRIMAEKVLARGDRVVGTARRTDAVDDLVKRHRNRFRVVPLEITDTAAIRRVVDDAFSRHGPIDVVVSNAGYGLFGGAEEASDEQIERQLATNLVGSIQLIRAALPHLRAQGGGRIVQVSSEGGQIAYPGFSLYHASKWGIEGFIEAIAQEVAPFGITLIIAEPGPTGTSFGAALDHTVVSSAYADTPLAAFRKALLSGDFPIRGDAVRTVDAMIAAADKSDPPFRLTLGSTAYESITAALKHRLEELSKQREVAFSADRQGV